ncbi:inositol monophosphatase family protein [Micromonospora sp. LOL_024]|uniref:inositol monophosphatase family protein n=1 Tax=Micromonospora sp. LOL_024 TaxID=3345412 RepID=UPI003A861665
MNLDRLWTDLTAELLGMLASFRSRVVDIDVQEKADHTLLTEADLAIEAMIISRIQALDPTARVLAEESGSGAWRPGVDEEPERIWVIDPIDGTAEIVRPHSVEFCSVVCLLERREPVAALIVAPPSWVPAARRSSCWPHGPTRRSRSTADRRRTTRNHDVSRP